MSKRSARAAWAPKPGMGTSSPAQIRAAAQQAPPLPPPMTTKPSPAAQPRSQAHLLQPREHRRRLRQRLCQRPRVLQLCLRQQHFDGHGGCVPLRAVHLWYGEETGEGGTLDMQACMHPCRSLPTQQWSLRVSGQPLSQPLQGSRTAASTNAQQLQRLPLPRPQAPSPAPHPPKGPLPDLLLQLQLLKGDRPQRTLLRRQRRAPPRPRRQRTLPAEGRRLAGRGARAGAAATVLLREGGDRVGG